VGGVFSPLDEVLALVPGSLSPHLLEGLVRVSSRLPFSQAAAELAFFWQAVVSDETARRVTEQAGTAYVGVQTAERERIRRELPEPPKGPALEWNGEYYVSFGGDANRSWEEAAKAVKEKGFFGNQNTVARPTTTAWGYTVDRLKQRWGID